MSLTKSVGVCFIRVACFLLKEKAVTHYVLPKRTLKRVLLLLSAEFINGSITIINSESGYVIQSKS